MLASYIAPSYPQPVDAKAVGRNLKTIREAREQTQEQLAAKLAVKQGRISNWERGRYKSFDMKTLIGLAKAYDTTVDDLLTGVDSDYDAKRDLIRHDDHGSSPAARLDARRGESSDAIAAQTRLLEHHIKKRAELAKAIEDALMQFSGRVVDLLSTDKADREDPALAPPRSIHRRVRGAAR